jgi:anti-anti-sigma regulatory factor
MGLQNATVTEISGAVVRTTHLTGVITDLGLESVRVFNWMRDRLRGWRWQRAGRVLRISTRHPSAQRLALLAGIFGSFIVGTIMGVFAYRYIPTMSLIPPVLFLLWIILLDWRKPIADVRELDLLSDPELKLHGIMHSILPPELGLYRLSHHRADQAHHPPDFHHWADHLPQRWRVIVLAVSPLTYFNDNSAADLRDVIRRLNDDGRELVVSGITPRQYQILSRAGIGDALDVENFCPDLEFAIARGITLVRQREPARLVQSAL